MVFAESSGKFGPLGEGLSDFEAAQRLIRDGTNEIPSREGQSLVRIIRSVLGEPMVFLLIACGLVYMALGDATEAALLLGFLALIVSITVIQKGKAERTLGTLRTRVITSALVHRSGISRRIDSRELVKGDLVAVNAGDRIPADGILLFAMDLAIDESLLTGEAMSVEKVTSSHFDDDRSMVFAGTIAVRGSGVFRVSATGKRTRIGEIGSAIILATREATPLELETRAVVRIAALFGVGLSVFVFLLSGFVRGQWLDGLLYGLTLAMAILPNEIPAVLSIYLSLGAWRLSRDHILTRQSNAIEALGATTVLCVDKTGTVTMNRMQVRTLYINGKYVSFESDGSFQRSSKWEGVGSLQGRDEALAAAAGDDAASPTKEGGDQGLSSEVRLLVESAFLASDPDSGDPTDSACIDAFKQLRGLSDKTSLSLLASYPVSENRLAMFRVWKELLSGKRLITVKGAPELICQLSRLSGSVFQQVLARVEELASKGLRVLAVARAEFAPEGSVRELRQLRQLREFAPQDCDYEFLGLIALADPVRPGVPDSVLDLRRAGVRVCLLTGDHLATAASVASEINIDQPFRVVSGAEVEKMAPSELNEVVKTTSVYCRVSPLAKLALVNAFQARGEVVAMTGDGVNDAPALKRAQVGIAMGAKGTDVARESASLVLLDDNFNSIVHAMWTGRSIYRNLQRAVSYLLAVHVPIAGLSVLPVALDMPMVLLPLHVAVIHLLIEPACSTVFEEISGEKGLMLAPPRSMKERLIDRTSMKWVLLQGAILCVLLFSIFGLSLWKGQAVKDARTLAFIALVSCSVGLIFTHCLDVYGSAAKAIRQNMALRRILIFVVPVLALTLYLPQIREGLGFTLLHFFDLLLCLAAGAIAALLSPGVFDQRQRLRRRVV